MKLYTANRLKDQLGRKIDCYSYPKSTDRYYDIHTLDNMKISHTLMVPGYWNLNDKESDKWIYDHAHIFKRHIPRKLVDELERNIDYAEEFSGDHRYNIRSPDDSIVAFSLSAPALWNFTEEQADEWIKERAHKTIWTPDNSTSPRTNPELESNDDQPA